MYRDITRDTQSLYRITRPGVFIFFAKNRSGSVTFSLEHSGAQAHAFFLFEGKQNDTLQLETLQRHTAKNTESHVRVVGVLNNTSRLDYSGTIRVEKNAPESVTSLDNKNLLLAPSTFAQTEPKLEILNDDVVCRHAAATAPLNAESITYLQSRGISPTRAKKLLTQGFLFDFQSRVDSLRKQYSDSTPSVIPE